MKLLFFICAFLLLTFAAFAQQPKTVTDFYLAFPSDIYATDNNGEKISGQTALHRFRRSLIKIEDRKNGYLRLEGAWEGWAEIALFKKKDGSYLVAQAESGCGPACLGFIKFFTYKTGKWKDVTAEVFPALTEAQIEKAFADHKLDTEENSTAYYFVLPQQGTTVKMACNQCSDAGNPHFTLLEFIWNGEKFAVRK